MVLHGFEGRLMSKPRVLAAAAHGAQRCSPRREESARTRGPPPIHVGKDGTMIKFYQFKRSMIHFKQFESSLLTSKKNSTSADYSLFKDSVNSL